MLFLLSLKIEVANSAFIDSAPPVKISSVFYQRQSEHTDAIRSLASFSRTLFEGIAYKKDSNTTGGAIYAEHTKVSLDFCFFSSNRSPNGGSLGTFDCQVEIFDTNFSSNYAEQEGGCLLLTGSDLRMSHCNFRDCESLGNGGCITFNQSTFFIEHCIFHANHAIQNGSAIYMCGSSGSVDFSFFSNNLCDTSKIGAVDIHESNLTLSNCFFNNNEANNERVQISIDDKSHVRSQLTCFNTPDRSKPYFDKMENNQSFFEENCLYKIPVFPQIQEEFKIKESIPSSINSWSFKITLALIIGAPIIIALSLPHICECGHI